MTMQMLFDLLARSCLSSRPSRYPTDWQEAAVAFCEAKVPHISNLQTYGNSSHSQGRQHLGAFFNFVAYYIIALPLGITLAFNEKTNMGLQGLWIGTNSSVSWRNILIWSFIVSRTGCWPHGCWGERIPCSLARYRLGF